MSQSVPAILRELLAAGVTVVLVADTDPAGLPAEVHHIRADPTDESAITRAQPADAEQALITGTSDGDVLVSSVLVRKQAPDLPTVAVVSSASVREALRDLGPARQSTTSSSTWPTSPRTTRRSRPSTRMPPQ
jgi:Trk K+ transport system NAD-binding subunit